MGYTAKQACEALDRYLNLSEKNNRKYKAKRVLF